jgi:hypothetical protein
MGLVPNGTPLRVKLGEFFDTFKGYFLLLLGGTGVLVVLVRYYLTGAVSVELLGAMMGILVMHFIQRGSPSK